MYVHCHECGWDNDDFQTNYYNPVAILRRAVKDVLFYRGAPLLFLAEIRHAAKMCFQRYKTLDDYRRKNPKGICPKCGARGLDMD